MKRKSIYVAPPDPEFKLGEARRAEGRTIEWIDYGLGKRSTRTHESEGMVIHFTDGSHLKLVIGSNAFNLGIDPEKLQVDIMVFFRESGERN